MSRLVALHWDQKQLLVATGQRAAGSFNIDRAVVVDLDAERPPLEQLAEKLKALGVQRGEATVVIGRSLVEMRQMDVPPVPANELPGLVRFQAQNQFAGAQDDYAIDYVPVAENGHVETVLAATLSNREIEQIKSAVEPAGLRVKHIAIRPFSAIEFIRSRQSDDECSLVINYFETEIDLTVAKRGYVNLSRSIRVTPPQDSDPTPEDYSEKIVLQEVRRTLAAAANQAEPVRVTQIIVCGQQANHELLFERLQDEVGLKVNFFHPFDNVRVRPAAKHSLPAHDGRFTPLLGSLIQQDSRDHHAIDFLNPRRVTKDTDSKRKLLLAGTGLAIVVLIALGWCLLTLQNQKTEIARLQNQLDNLIEQNQGVDEIIDKTAVVDDWMQDSIAWLDELYEVSDRYLSPDDARVTRFGGALNRGRTLITLPGYAANADINSELRRQLESRPYRISFSKQGKTTAGDENPLAGDMTFEFSETLEFDNSRRELPTNLLAERLAEQSSAPAVSEHDATASPGALDPDEVATEPPSDQSPSDQPPSDQPPSDQPPSDRLDIDRQAPQGDRDDDPGEETSSPDNNPGDADDE